MVMLGRATGVDGSRAGWRGGAGARRSAGPSIGFAVAAVMMSTVAVMHEHVHQRTGGQEQPRQEGKDVSAVLGQQEENADDSEEAEYELGTRCPNIKVGFDRFIHGHCSITV